MKQIIVNENNVVIGFSEGNGYIKGGIDVEYIPADFESEKYKYIDGEYMTNSDYKSGILEEYKTEKISESKAKLAEWLEANPMLYGDGKYYSVTEEKQSLLNNNLTSYERADEAGVPYPLKWNATGEECVEWVYEELVALSLAIAAYVAPKVAAQQAVEIRINACTTLEEIAEVVIDYA